METPSSAEAVLVPGGSTVQPASVTQPGTTDSGPTFSETGRGIEREFSDSQSERGISVPAGEGLARWLTAQVQLPGFVADEDWTPEHTEEFARFCDDPNRRHWFLWMVGLSRRSCSNHREDEGPEMDRCGRKRLMFSNELPASCIAPALRHIPVKERREDGLVFIVKRDFFALKPDAPEEQLLCLSFHGSVLEQIAAFIRGICIPVLGENYLWPQSFKKDILRRACG